MAFKKLKRSDDWVFGPEEPDERNMKDGVAYKDCLIRGESFQREKNGTWVPQYALTRQETGSQRKGFPSYQYQFSEAYPTESEANDYALQRAREWIDRN